MEYLEDLQSGSSPRVAKAARKISKEQLSGYCDFLLSALKSEMLKPRAWKTQTQLIKTIGICGCSQALSTLKELIDEDYKATILYRELAFSILMLENISKLNLDFLFTSIKKGNSLQIAGACSAILYKKIIPQRKDIERILTGISPYTQDENKVTSPRTYIAAIAYTWPEEEVCEFLEECKKSHDRVLVEIAESSLKRQKPKQILI